MKKERTWLEISEKALVHNFGQFRNLVGKNVGIMSVVKANAYGHGLSQVAPIMDKLGTDWFGMDSLEEALEIRRLGILKPILVLGFIPKENLAEAVVSDVSFVVYDIETIEHIKKLSLNRKAKVHLKIETGTNRQGMQLDVLGEVIDLTRTCGESFVVEGGYSHLANVEDTLDPSFALAQMDQLATAVTRLSGKGLKPPYVHLAATGAIMLHEKSWFNLVRLGIGLYGEWPSREVQTVCKTSHPDFTLQPVMSWKSLVAQVKTVNIGDTVGYGRSWCATRESRIAIIPVGYYDGYDRKLSNNSYVLIKGQRAPVVGRVAMNMMAVDVTDCPKIDIEDIVTLLGEDGDQRIRATELAERIGTITYEVVSRINPMLPRLVKIND